MIDFLLLIASETWYIIKEASVFLLFGFLIAGVLAVVVPGRLMTRFFGRGKVKSVLWASALGVPLPLCSCGVLPTALGLRRQGATKGATVSFLISTPETGVDSISVSYALMDPIITVFRPLAAVVTAISAGLATNFLGEPRGAKDQPEEDAKAAALEHDDCCAPDDHGHDHEDEHGHDHSKLIETDLPVGAKAKTRKIFSYAFRDLLDETSYWLVLGFVLSGIVGAALPPTIIEQYLSDPFMSMVLMLVIGIPIYTCASASTPIAAAFVLKGLNPGAALVFLLAGPATNLGSLTVLVKFLGARIVAIYLTTIVIMTLIAGYSLNLVYSYWDINPVASYGKATAFIPESVKISGALLLVGLLLLSMMRTHVPGEWLQLRNWLAVVSGVFLTGRRLKIGALATLGVLYVSTGLFAVAPGQIGIKSRFGAIVAPDLAPGLHYRLPWPFEAHQVVDRALVRRVEFGFRSAQPENLGEKARARATLTVGGPSNPVPQAIAATGFWFQKEKVAGESFLLTGDVNLLDMSFTVHYRATDPVAFAFGLAEPEELVRGLTFSALRQVIGTTRIDDVYTTSRGAIEVAVQDRVQAILDDYGTGIELVSVRLLYVHPPEEVHDSFRDVASAQEDKIHIMNRAATFAIEDVNLAEGEAATMIEEAIGFRDAAILRAEGDAAAFGRRLTEYRQAPELTEFRLQLEAVEEVLPRAQKFLRPGAGDVKDLDLWLLEPFPASKDQ